MKKLAIYLLLAIVLANIATGIELDEWQGQSISHGDYYLSIGTMCTKPAATALFLDCAWNPLDVGNIFGCIWLDTSIGLNGDDLTISQYRCTTRSTTLRSSTI